MRILAIDTATEACSVALWNDGTVNAHFELCPREHTQRILPMVQDILTTSGTSLTDINALASGAAPVALLACALVLASRIGWRLAGITDDWRLHANDDGARGVAKTAQPACWQPLTREWAKFTGPNISVMKTVSGTVKKPKPYSNPKSSMNECNSFPGEWVTVGTGWQAWPDLGKRAGRFYAMAKCYCLLLKICCRLRVRCLLRKTVAVEHAEPVYLRNNVAWKKLPGKE